MYASYMLIAEARKKTAELNIPGETPLATSENADPAEAAKAAAEHAKFRVDAFKCFLELVQAEKVILDRQIIQSEEAKSAANIFINAIDGLNLFLLEIKWRTEDGTLAFDKVPDSLNMKRLGIQKQELVTKQDDLGRKSKTAQEELKTIVSRMEKTKKTLIETEAGYTSMEKRYALELKQRTLEKEYSEQSPEKLTAALSKLQEERIWLNGTFNMSRTRFSNSQANASMPHFNAG